MIPILSSPGILNVSEKCKSPWGPTLLYNPIPIPTATPAATSSPLFTFNNKAPAIYPSPGPYWPPLPPGTGAPPELPPPSTLGLAVGRLLAVVVLLDVVPFPDPDPEVEFPDDGEDALPDGVADAEGCNVTRLVMICDVV